MAHRQIRRIHALRVPPDRPRSTLLEAKPEIRQCEGFFRRFEDGRRRRGRNSIDRNLALAGNQVEAALMTPMRRRRPTLSAALRAAQKAGRQVKSAVVEDGKVTLTFGDDTSVESSSNEWDEALRKDC